MVLEEPKVPYEVKLLEFLEMKQAAYEKINPNGRLLQLKIPKLESLSGSPGQSSNTLRRSTMKRASFPPNSPEFYHAIQ